MTIAVAPGSPVGLGITSNGSPIGRVLFGSPMPVDPGEYRVVAQADGFDEWATKVVITPDTLSTLVVIPPLVAKPRGMVGLAQSVSNPSLGQTAELTHTIPAQTPTDSRAFRRTLGYIFGTVGIAAIGLGVGFALAKEAKQSDRDSANACSKTSSCTTLDRSKIDQLTNEAKTRATVANVGFVAGGVALAAGAILVVTGWPKSTPSARAQVQPWIGGRSAGFVVGGVW